MNKKIELIKRFRNHLDFEKIVTDIISGVPTLDAILNNINVDTSMIIYALDSLNMNTEGKRWFIRKNESNMSNKEASELYNKSLKDIKESIEEL